MLWRAGYNSSGKDIWRYANIVVDIQQKILLHIENTIVVYYPIKLILAIEYDFITLTEMNLAYCENCFTNTNKNIICICIRESCRDRNGFLNRTPSIFLVIMEK